MKKFNFNVFCSAQTCDEGHKLCCVVCVILTQPDANVVDLCPMLERLPTTSNYTHNTKHETGPILGNLNERQI